MTCEECGYVGPERDFVEVAERDGEYMLCVNCLEEAGDIWHQIQEANYA